MKIITAEDLVIAMQLDGMRTCDDLISMHEQQEPISPERVADQRWNAKRLHEACKVAQSTLELLRKEATA